jgi:lipopolysaccharide transport system permease protein
MVPEKYRPLMFLNPLTFVIEQARNVALFGRMPDWPGLAIYTIFAVGVAWLGFWWFQRIRTGFADVI